MESTKTETKNKGKKWLSTCFRPVVMDDTFKPTSRKGQTTDPVLTYFAVAEKDGVVLPAVLSLTAAEGGKEESRRRKRGRDSSLWQTLRAALNETSLVKKIISRRKKNKDNLSRSSSNLEGKGDKISKPGRRNTHQTKLNSYSSFSCSSAFTSSSGSSSSCSSCSQDSGSHSSEIYSSLQTNRIGATKHKHFEDSRKRCYGSNTALCMLLISLLVLIMWGRFVAILITLIWFYLMPPGRRRPCNYEPKLCGEREFDSVQYKKKIIMEGLLERKRSHLTLASMRKSS